MAAQQVIGRMCRGREVTPSSQRSRRENNHRRSEHMRTEVLTTPLRPMEATTSGESRWVRKTCTNNFHRLYANRRETILATLAIGTKPLGSCLRDDLPRHADPADVRRWPQSVDAKRHLLDLSEPDYVVNPWMLAKGVSRNRSCDLGTDRATYFYRRAGNIYGTSGCRVQTVQPPEQKCREDYLLATTKKASLNHQPFPERARKSETTISAGCARC